MSNIIPIEHNNQRVLTTQQLADGYETDAQIIRNNFNRNKDRYIPGIHYYLLEGAEFQAFKATNQIDLPLNINSMYLWTEKGALLHAKSLNTDRAWEVYQELVDTYFRAKELQQPLMSQIQILQQAINILAEQERKLLAIEGTVSAIKDTIIQEPDNWREDINRMFNKIVDRIGGEKFQEVRHESYKLLEQRAHVDLNRRLMNLRTRMLDQGATKTAIEKANKLDVIEQDPKLREIYSQIIKEYYIKFVA